MKNFVRARRKEGAAFKYLAAKFPALSEAKLKAGVFVGPQIHTLFHDSEFEACLIDIEKQAWLSFKDVVQMFLGNHKAKDYKELVQNMLDQFRKHGSCISLKMHFQFSHIEYFPENLGDFSEEQGERFHQDIGQMEQRYQGRWNINLMADFCWTLKRDSDTSEYRRQSRKRRFMP